MGQYIVLDLEWNQSPLGKDGSMDRLPFEIIEIGAVKLNASLQIISEFRRLIRPRVYRQMHFKISEVTHMSMDELNMEGEEFGKAMEEFLAWCGDDYKFCTWGSMDLTELQRNMAYHKLPNPFPRPLLYLDIQKLYCLQYGDGKNKVSLDMAVQLQEMEEERPFHRALDDAYYTGRILSALDMETYGTYVSVDYYGLPRNKAEEYRLYFPEYSKYVSREFDSREDILKDKDITDMKCVKCNRMLRKKLRWFPYGQRFYFCLAVCPEHGVVKGKIRVKKSEDDRFYAVKTAKMADAQDVELLVQRKEDSRKKRSAKAHHKEALKPLKGRSKQNQSDKVS